MDFLLLLDTHPLGSTVLCGMVHVINRPVQLGFVVFQRGLSGVYQTVPAALDLIQRANTVLYNSSSGFFLVVPSMFHTITGMRTQQTCYPTKTVLPSAARGDNCTQRTLSNRSSYIVNPVHGQKKGQISAWRM